MFAIGFLLAFSVVLFAVHLLIKIFPNKVRPLVWRVVFVLAISLPFWHHLSPSYREFNTLCARSDRYVLMKTVEVDYAFSTSTSFGAYRRNEGRGFRGFDIKQGKSGYLRYTQNENWPSTSCQQDCADPSIFIWEKRCETSCLTKSAVAAPEFEYSVKYSSTTTHEGRLLQHKSTVVGATGEELAIALNYTYYPYGTGWATVLGGASGSAPTLSCKTKTNFDGQEFIRPRSTKSQ